MSYTITEAIQEMAKKNGTIDASKIYNENVTLTERINPVDQFLIQEEDVAANDDIDIKNIHLPKIGGTKSLSEWVKDIKIYAEHVTKLTERTEIKGDLRTMKILLKNAYNIANDLSEIFGVNFPVDNY